MATIATYPFIRSLMLNAFLLCVGAATSAQDTVASNDAIERRYVKIALGPGTAKNFGGYVSLLVSKKRFYALDLNEISRKPSYTPPGYNGPLICIFGDCMPRESFSYFTFFTGHYFINKPKMRFGAAAGPSFVIFRKVLFEEVITNPGAWLDFGPGYDISYSKRIGGGIALRTGAEFRLLKWLWLEPAFYANINTQHNTGSGNLFVSLEIPAGRKKSSPLSTRTYNKLFQKPI